MPRMPVWVCTPNGTRDPLSPVGKISTPSSSNLGLRCIPAAVNIQSASASFCASEIPAVNTTFIHPPQCLPGVSCAMLNAIRRNIAMVSNIRLTCALPPLSMSNRRILVRPSLLKNGAVMVRSPRMCAASTARVSGLGCLLSAFGSMYLYFLPGGCITP